MLARSSKKTPSGHYIKSDPGFLEFNEVKNVRDIHKGMPQPADMHWSIEEFLKHLDQTM